jgi:hypothetical protein
VPLHRWAIQSDEVVSNPMKDNEREPHSCHRRAELCGARLMRTEYRTEYQRQQDLGDLQQLVTLYRDRSTRRFAALQAASTMLEAPSAPCRNLLALSPPCRELRGQRD